MQKVPVSKIGAYISGPLTNNDDPGPLRLFYERLGNLCTELGLHPYIPHLHTDPVLHPNKSPQEVYAADMEQVQRSRLVLAYVGLPSHGVGAEIERAFHAGTDVILLYEDTATVSRLIRGCPAVIAEVVFSTPNDLIVKLRPVLGEWLQNLGQGNQPKEAQNVSN